MKEDELLESWKEISSYLKRNIRTCQYWEKKHGLPVHRLEDSPKARVFAYRNELDRWLQDKLHEGEIVKRNILFSFFQKNMTLSIFVFVLLCLVICTLIILSLFQRNKIEPLLSSKPSAVIMPFINNTGDSDLDYLSQNLSDMLITDLSQSKHVDVFRRDRISAVLYNLDLSHVHNYSSIDLGKVAASLGASFIIMGRYTNIAETFRIEIDIIETQSMKSVGIEKSEGLKTNFFEMIDELTTRIKSHLNLTDEAIAHDIDERVGEVTTDHPEVWRLYIKGKNFHNRDEYEKSIAAMEKALVIDPEFALALRSISESYNNLGRLSKSREYAERALGYRERFTDRERYHFELLFYGSSERTWEKAIASGIDLIRNYPDDLRGYELANLFFWLEQWDKAIEYYQVFVQNEEISYFPYQGIASSYEAKGMYNRASVILKSYLHDIFEHDSIRRQLAYCYLCQGRYDLAREEAARLDPWNSDILAYIYHCTGELDKAEINYFHMLDSRINKDIVTAQRLLGSLYLLQGRFKDAEEQLLQGVAFAHQIGELNWKHEIQTELAYFYLATGNPLKALEKNSLALAFAEEGESIRRQVESLHLLGLISIQLGRLKDAQQAAERLRSLVDNRLNRKLMRYYFHLMGKIKFEKKDFPKAIGNFKKAIAHLPAQHYEWHFRLPIPHALLFESLAETYHKSGNLDQALEEYEKVSQLTLGKLWYGDKYRNSHFIMGEIFDQKGQREEAMHHYEIFIKILENADPDNKNAMEAQKRILALKGAEKRINPQ